MDTLKVIRKPIVSEKAFLEAGKGEYSFEVEPKATKGEIAKAVAQMFGVDVTNVKTRIIKNRSRRQLRVRGRIGLGPLKKATVRLGKDQKIVIFETSEEKK